MWLLVFRKRLVALINMEEIVTSGPVDQKLFCYMRNLYRKRQTRRPPEKNNAAFYQRRGLRQFSGKVSDQGNN